MAGFSDYVVTDFLAAVFRGSSFTAPATLAIALCTAAPTHTSTGATITEVSNSGTAYARQTLNPSTSNWSAPSGNPLATSNSATITFPTATANWGTVTHVAICDSATYGAGNLLFWAALTASETVNTGGTFSFSTSNLSCSLS